MVEVLGGIRGWLTLFICFKMVCSGGEWKWHLLNELCKLGLRDWSIDMILKSYLLHGARAILTPEIIRNKFAMIG